MFRSCENSSFFFVGNYCGFLYLGVYCKKRFSKETVIILSEKRSSGVLMSISAIPSRYGVGTFGKECVDFANKIAEMGFSYWQVLPFTPLDYANSPYGSDSAFAGNELYISPDMMVGDGFVTKEEAESNEYSGSPYIANYEFAREKREQLLRLAFSRLDAKQKRDVDEFTAEKELFPHCLFRALKKANGNKKFWEFSPPFVLV